jgi:hypothetical protein
MWVDSGAASLSIASLLVKFFTFILLVIIISLFFYQYLRKRNNKSLSKKVAIIGIGLSTFLFLINVLMTYDHINFVQEQIEIVNNPDYRAGFGFIREGWIESGYSNIVLQIGYSVIFGLLPLWIFYRQFKRILIE